MQYYVRYTRYILSFMLLCSMLCQSDDGCDVSREPRLQEQQVQLSQPTVAIDIPRDLAVRRISALQTGGIVFFQDSIDLQNNNIINANSLSSASSVTVTYNSDGMGSDAFIVEENGTPAFRVDSSSVSVLSGRDLVVDGGVIELDSASNIITASGGDLIIDLGSVTSEADILQEAKNTDPGGGVLSLAFGSDGFLYAGTNVNEVIKFDPSDLSQEDINSTDPGGGVLSLAYGSDGFLYAGTGGNEVIKFDPSDLSQVAINDTDPGGSVLSLAFGSDGFLYAGTDAFEVIKFTALDIEGDLDIQGVGLAEDLTNYQVLLIANDGSLVRRTPDTADEFLQVVASSKRYKRNIGSVDDAVDRLRHATPVSFFYRGVRDDGKIHYGMLAEELARIMPELVQYDDAGQPDKVRYIEMIPLLLKYIQEQQRTFEEQQQALQAQINELWNYITS